MLLKKYWQKLAVLSFGHGLNDFTAGYMLASLFYSDSQSQTVAGFLIYNLLAFGGQYFAALLIEKINTKHALTGAAVLNVIALILFSFNPFLSLVLTGCASATYHVAGGASCISHNKATGIGVFAAPGIIGLVLAGYLAHQGLNVWDILLCTCIGFVFLLQTVQITNPVKEAQMENQTAVEIDRHDLLMILLLAIILLRSAIWNIFQLLHEQNYTWLIAIGLSAFAGKIIGGWLSDKIGWKFYSLVSLVTAMPLVTFFKEELLLFSIGIGLLQSAIPANTALLIQYTNSKEKAIGLSFGTAIVIGIFITAPVQYFGVNGMTLGLVIVLFLATILLLKRSKKNLTISTNSKLQRLTA